MRAFGAVTDDLPDEEFPMEPINNLNRRRSSITDVSSQQRISMMYSMLSTRYLWFTGLTAALLVTVFLIHQLAMYNLASQSCRCSLNDRLPQQGVVFASLATHTKVPCTSDGAKDCKAICTTLAITAPNLYRKMVCEKRRNVERFWGTLFYQPCAYSVWQPTHLHMQVCCKGAVPYDCKENLGCE